MAGEDGIQVILSPVQLATILAGEQVNQGETRTNRLWGGLQMIGGTLEMVGAAALILAPEPTLATKAGGLVLAGHGSDTISSGFWQMWTGRPQRTLTDRAATELALRLGATQNTAEMIGTGVDIAVPLLVASAAGAARLSAVRSGRISLIEHEASLGSKIGGHSIRDHVGRPEAYLRKRLLDEKHIKSASTFKSLDAAERVLYKAIRNNRIAIEQWAKTAKPGAKQEFTYSANEVIGQGVVRATDKLTPMMNLRFVLKMEAYNGKLFYILTSYPTP